MLVKSRWMLPAIITQTCKDQHAIIVLVNRHHSEESNETTIELCLASLRMETFTRIDSFSVTLRLLFCERITKDGRFK